METQQYSDFTRILQLLEKAPASVAQISKALNIRPPKVHQLLTKLRKQDKVLFDSKRFCPIAKAEVNFYYPNPEINNSW